MKVNGFNEEEKTKKDMERFHEEEILQTIAALTQDFPEGWQHHCKCKEMIRKAFVAGAIAQYVDGFQSPATTIELPREPIYGDTSVFVVVVMKEGFGTFEKVLEVDVRASEPPGQILEIAYYMAREHCAKQRREAKA